MANHMRWSIQNISKFYGNPNQDPEYHVREFEDVLIASNQWPDNLVNVPDQDASRIIVNNCTSYEIKNESGSTSSSVLRSGVLM